MKGEEVRVRSEGEELRMRVEHQGDAGDGYRVDSSLILIENKEKSSLL
jgi:predicted RNA-binding protein with TRAM domain